jgi:predicted alpha-1,2-mannosidase
MRSVPAHLRTPLVALLVAAFLTVPSDHASHVLPGRLTDLVNTFIGSRDEGNTFPGATVPFGMTQLSPDTGHSTGYDYGQSRIRGFSAVHLSGVGCGIGGDLPMLPTTGAVTSTDDARYAASYSHLTERAAPGYYRVGLSSYGGITAELTATTRTGWQRYTFPRTGRANVLIDTGQALRAVTSSTVRVLDDRTVETSVTGSGFCWGTRPYTLYAVTRFDRPFTGHGTWSGDRVTAGSSGSAGGGRRGAYLRFDTRHDRTVTAVTALSYVGAHGALGNLAAEGHGTFDGTARAARSAWERRLETVRVSGGTDERRRTFYSALYRALLSPNTGSDADGSYTGWDGRVHRANGFTYYQNWSLWDTYRTQAQLLSLIAPGETRDMALSLLRVAAEGGWLPKWGYTTVETNVMTGDPVTPFLVNAFNQGLLKGHEGEAYAALRRNADQLPPPGSQFEGRGGNPDYLADGYVPLDPKAPREAYKPGDPLDMDESRGASATLEYALSDAALATMADALGHTADARRYRARGQDYRNVFDPRTGDFRPRDPDGLFTGPTDPAQGTGFHEGSALQYLWQVPQDVPGLIRLIGGDTTADDRLDTFFAYDRLLRDPAGTAREVWVHGPYAYYDQSTYNPQNEPDLIAPYTYLSTGQPWKTTDVVHAALGLFTDAPDGITGNDDLGTMSSWDVLSSIGLFPVSPGSATWGLTTPVFSRVELTLDRRFYPRGRLTVTAPGTSDSRRYIRSVTVGGRRRTATWVTTADIRAGRDISFGLGGAPSAWGTGPGDAPPATDGVPLPQRRVALGVTPASATAAPGGTVRLTADAVLTRPGRASGVLTATAAAPLTAAPARRALLVRSGDTPSTVRTPVTVTVAPDAPPGRHPVTVTVTDPDGHTATRTVTVTVTAATTRRRGRGK